MSNYQAETDRDDTQGGEWWTAEVLAQAPFGLWRLDARGRVAHVAGRIWHEAGLGRDETATPCARLLARLSPGDRRRLRAAIRRAMHWSEPTFSCVVTLTVSAGKAPLVLMVGGELDPVTRRLESGWVQDHTVQRRAEEAMDEARRSGERAISGRARLLSLVEEEVRAPLQVAADLVRLAVNGGAAREELLGVALRTQDEIIEFLDAVREAAALDAGRVEARIAPASLVEIARTAADAVRPALEARGARLTLQVDPAAPATLPLDQARLASMVRAALINAGRHARDGAITLAVRGGDDVRIEVLDDGPAFFGDAGAPGAEGDSERRFGPRAAGALGLALDNVRRMAGVVGARLSVGAGPAGGGRCSLILQGAGTEAAGGRRRRAGRPRALIVDDNPANQQLLQIFLDRLGWDAAIAEDGVQGVQTARGGGIDVVLMDMHMPRMDGLDAVRAIRALDGGASEVAIWMVTADARPGVKADAFAAGVDGFLTKPIDMRDLAARLKALADGRQAGARQADADGSAGDEARRAGARPAPDYSAGTGAAA